MAAPPSQGFTPPVPGCVDGPPVMEERYFEDLEESARPPSPEEGDPEFWAEPFEDSSPKPPEVETPEASSQRNSLELLQQRKPRRAPTAESTGTILEGMVSHHSTELEKKMLQNSLRESLKKEQYDVSMYYWSAKRPGFRGRASALAQNDTFEKITLAVISCNALWIAYDTDANKETILNKADAQFQIAEHFFCAFFSFEWTTRFLAFQSKRNCFRDGWFVFDSLLVSTMVAETWMLALVMALAGSSGGGGGSTAMLRILRLLRLSRMLRMGRLLRACPELLIQLKGLTAALRTVCVNLSLLLLFLYVFAILIKQLMDPSDAQRRHFPTVQGSMYTLLLYATFMDSLWYMTELLREENQVIMAVFFLSLIFTGMAVQNMLIGVLCEVVSSVGEEERANLKRGFVEDQITTVMSKMGCTDGQVTKHNFMKIFEEIDMSASVDGENGKSMATLIGDCGVDVAELLDFSDFIFYTEVTGEGERVLCFDEFVDIVMQMRGDKEATVKDMVDLRKFLRGQIRELGEQRMAQLIKLRVKLETGFGNLNRKLALFQDVLAGVPPALVSSFRPPPPAEGSPRHPHAYWDSPRRGSATVPEDRGDGYAGRLGRVECALAFAKLELQSLASDIAAAPLKQ